MKTAVSERSGTLLQRRTACSARGSPCRPQRLGGPADAGRAGGTHGYRDRAPIHGRRRERHPLDQGLNPDALMPAALRSAHGRGHEPRRAPPEALEGCGRTRCTARLRFGHAARGTAGSGTDGTRGGCHTVDNAVCPRRVWSGRTRRRTGRGARPRSSIVHDTGTVCMTLFLLS